MRFARERRTAAAIVAALALLGGTAVAPAYAGERAQAQTRPNILFVLTDDQRWDTLSAMPNVQRDLVARGVTFTNAFVVNPLCCPSRATILTGLYSHSTGVWRNGGAFGGFPSFRDDSTVATWLQAAGYRTAYVGRYMNGYGSTYVPPGWDRWVAYNTGFYNYALNVDGVPTVFGSAEADYSTDVLAAEAASFVRGTKEPFFLVLAPFAPHHPATPAPRHAGAFSDLPPWRPPSWNEDDVSDKPAWLHPVRPFDYLGQARVDELRRNQLRSLLAVDDAVGELVDLLAKTGRLENTLIVFTSDNGFTWGEHRFAAKAIPYEESIRVPLVARYDALVTQPRFDSRFVLNVDLAPTFADLAGVVPPRVEGTSLRPLLSSAPTEWRRDFLIEHLRTSHWTVLPTYCAVRNERWKYVAYESGDEELYDLALDPYELENRAGDRAVAPVLQAARKRLAALCNPPPPLVCTITGTESDDVLRGTGRYDVTCARAGNDTLAGRRGNDILLGGRGHDIASGGAGNDTVRGGPGSDVLRAGAGRDRLFGGSGRDHLYARDGEADEVACGRGHDVVYADSVDRLLAGCEDVRLG